jgi:predicted ATPase/DNA-binding winged helix-turn-helix (wHTH) protein
VLEATRTIDGMEGGPAHPATIEFGRFTLIGHRRELLVDGRPIELGGRAFDTLMALVEAPGTVVSKDALMSRVWPDRVVEENNLQLQISTLRKAFGADRHLIRTVAGHGYQFTGEIHATAMADPPVAPPAPMTNLPAAVSELIGRQAELRDVIDLVSAHRLVTLIGAGGIGKTRLGLEAARHLVPKFRDGVIVAELGPLSSPDLVPVTVAAALRLTLVADTASPERIAGAVGTKEVLLVLDNCEHVIEAAARMTEALLRASPGLSLLATSREPLRAEGEYVYRVPPLALPAEDADPEDVLRHDAVRLFVIRAHAAEPQTMPDVRIAAAAAAICRRLDGMPLAIELAAARVASFGVEGIAARLDDRFKLLTSGARTALPRHQTLRATFDWSYELLPGRERIVFRRLAVFAGSFALDAATAVAASIDIAPADVVDALANLVSRSLVSADVSAGVAHYRLLETTRAYALEKLGESEELDRFALRHAEYYRDLCERNEREWIASPPSDWLAVYSRQIDNVRLALDWAFSPSGDAAVGAALTVATVPLWVHLSLMTECCARVEQALATLGPHVPPDARRDMRLYLSLGNALLHTRSVGSRDMSAAFARALELAESLDDTEYRLRAIFGLYVCRFITGDYRGALTLAERLYAIAAKTPDPTDALIADRLIGAVQHILGDQAGARRRVEPMVQADFATVRRSHIIRYQFDQRVVTHAYYARILWLQGCADQAMHVVERIVDYARAKDHVTSLFYALVQAACPVALAAGDLAAAGRFVALIVDLSVKHAREPWRVWAQCFEGALLIERGDCAAGAQRLRAALAELPEAAFHIHNAPFLGALATGLGGTGQIADGRVVIDTALERAERTEEWWLFA